MAQNEHSGTLPDGLAGVAVCLEDLAALDFFAPRKSNFMDRLRDNLVHRVTGTPIRAAVRRDYHSGAIICNAGEYGSTAFLIVEGRATAFVPQEQRPASVPGRTARSLHRLRRLFARRTQATRREPPEHTDIGEISADATVRCTHPPAEVHLGPGDVFGIDTCINFYPRDATVRADEPCVVIEMLRSVLDTVRGSGKAHDRIDAAYVQAAVRNTLARQPLFENLPGHALEQLAAAAELLTQDDFTDGVIYHEGATPDAVYLVHAGTIKISQLRARREFIWTYLGRGTALGIEALLPIQAPLRLVLQPLSHPGLAAVPLAGTVSIGRRPSASVAIPKTEGTISRKHCRFEEHDGDVYLIDEDSDNGTFLNNERIREAVVSAGDRVTLADSFVFQIIAEPPATPSERGTRQATATALDNVEVIKLPQALLLQMADERLVHSAGIAAQALQASQQQTTTEQAFQNELIDLNLYNSQNVLLIDLDCCTRCDECVRACADAHGGIARFTRDGPRFGKYLVTLACRSCTDPKCMVGCPVGSIRRRESLEIHIEDWCVGCMSCANNCPFGAINMVDLAAPAPRGASVGPIDLSSGKLLATVCDLCAGYDGPSCVYACPHDAAIRVNPAAYLSPADLRRS